MKAHTAAICALFLAASGAAGCASAPDGGWITTGDQSRLMQHEPLMMRRAAVQATGQAVLLDPQTPLQTMVGFGAAITACHQVSQL